MGQCLFPTKDKELYSDQSDDFTSELTTVLHQKERQPALKTVEDPAQGSLVGAR